MPCVRSCHLGANVHTNAARSEPICCLFCRSSNLHSDRQAGKGRVERRDREEGEETSYSSLRIRETIKNFLDQLWQDHLKLLDIYEA